MKKLTHWYWHSIEERRKYLTNKFLFIESNTNGDCGIVTSAPAFARPNGGACFCKPKAIQCNPSKEKGSCQVGGSKQAHQSPQGINICILNFSCNEALARLSSKPSHLRCTYGHDHSWQRMIALLFILILLCFWSKFLYLVMFGAKYV